MDPSRKALPHVQIEKGGPSSVNESTVRTTPTWFEQKDPPKMGVPWYKPEIGPRLKPAMLDFYKTYVGLTGEALIDHLHNIVGLSLHSTSSLAGDFILNPSCLLTLTYTLPPLLQRDRAWPLGEYPCIGQWMFLLPSITCFPVYSQLVARTKTGATVLDLGCCFGQDLRRLVADGGSMDNMYASDLSRELWDIGFDLFRDRDRMKARFIQADIFDQNSELVDFKGRFDIILVCQFLHLFSLQQQLEAIKKIIGFSKAGTVLIGYQIGRVEAIEESRPWGIMFYHNVQSFQAMWRQAERDTETSWDVDVTIVDLHLWGMEKEDFTWMAPGSRGLNFTVTRKMNILEQSPKPTL